MAMSRSFGGTSLTTSPPIAMSPPEISSRPAIMRKVVLLPQPEGPTSTMNSLSVMSRSMPRTAWTSSYILTTLRSVTCAICRYLLALGRAGRQTRNVVVHEEGVDDERRRRAEQRAGHDLTPVEDVALDQGRDDADGQHQLGGRGGEGQGIEELRPRHREAEDRRGDDAGQRHRDEDLGQRLDPGRAVDQGSLVQFLRDRC